MGFESFCVDDWCNGIMNIDSKFDGFDGSKFTSERMANDTLGLVTS